MLPSLRTAGVARATNVGLPESSFIATCKYSTANSRLWGNGKDSLDAVTGTNKTGQYDSVHLQFNSISGGIDLNSGFACGNPTLPVYAGEVSAPSLGMKIRAYDEDGNPVIDQEGELVCEAPSPSMPLYFWDDGKYERYNEAYLISIGLSERMFGGMAIMSLCTLTLEELPSSDAQTPS